VALPSRRRPLTVVRLPLLSGSRVVVVTAGDGDVVLRPPPPLDPIADVGAAVRDALRYPLSGPPLQQLTRSGSRVTVVVDHPSLPFPGAPVDPRQEALAAVLAELERLGVRSERQTILVAGGLERRAGQDQLEELLSPRRARGFRGSVAVHDCESPSLELLDVDHGVALRAAPELIATDLVVVVSAAETVLHGGPAALLAACGPEAVRAAAAESLLEPGRAPGWRLALALERLLAARAPLLGVSLVLDHPQPTGRLRGYPHDEAETARLARSPARLVLNSLPGSLRRALLQSHSRRLRAVAAFAGPPSVAHAEALLRGIALRGTAVERPLDAIVLPVPWDAPHHPREPVNPVTAAYAAFGLALRLWRDRFPVVEGGTAVLLHGFGRAFGNGPGAPYRALFHILRDDRDRERLGETERTAASDTQAIDAYRRGRASHPLLPYADWAACTPALARLGSVIVAGCRDAGAARALGFVPSHSVSTALDMTHGVAEGRARVGVLVAPPYFPLVTGSGGD
jgi:lactate racemase-like protein